MNWIFSCCYSSLCYLCII